MAFDAGGGADATPPPTAEGYPYDDNWYAWIEQEVLEVQNSVHSLQNAVESNTGMVNGFYAHGAGED